MESGTQSQPESPGIKRERVTVAAQACEYCRSRKSKCDEGRPRCTTCLKYGYECVYEEPRPTKRDKTLTQVLEVLQRMDDRINTLCKEVASVSSLMTQPAHIAQSKASQFQSDQPQDSPPRTRPRPPDATMKDIFSWPAVSETLAGELGDAGEILETLRVGGARVLGLLGRQSASRHFPTTAAFDTVPRAGDMIPGPPASRVDFPSLPLEDIRLFSTAYFNAYNPLFPILDPEVYYSETLREVTDNGFGEGSTASVIVLLVAALGRLALEGSSGKPLLDELGKDSGGIRGGSLGRPPGFELFQEAQRRIGLEMTRFRLEQVQIFSLAAAYYAQCFRHAEFWRMTEHACTTYMAFRASESPGSEAETTEEVRRAYWLCFLMQSGVLLDLRLPLTSLTGVEEDLPLPNFRERTVTTSEENYYMHFLAEISLSRLLARIHSFQDSFAVQRPYTSAGEAHQDSNLMFPEAGDLDHLWVTEMDHQLEEWRAHLPAQLKWNEGHTAEMPNASNEPLSSDPLFLPSGAHQMPLELIHNLEVLIAVLRSRYLYAKFVIWLPVLYKALHFPDRMTRKDAQDCTTFLQHCVYWPVSMSPPRDKKRLVPHIHGWTYRFLEILVILHITTRSPVLRYIRERSFSIGEVEESAGLMLDWIRDTKQTDPLAQCAWKILSTMYPV